jgi:hypothetical protein
MVSRQPWQFIDYQICASNGLNDIESQKHVPIKALSHPLKHPNAPQGGRITPLSPEKSTSSSCNDPCADLSAAIQSEVLTGAQSFGNFYFGVKKQA